MGFRPSAEGRRGSRVRGGGERGPETGEQEAEQRAPPHFLVFQEEIQNFQEEIQKKFKKKSKEVRRERGGPETQEPEPEPRPTYSFPHISICFISCFMYVANLRHKFKPKKPRNVYLRLTLIWQHRDNWMSIVL